MPRTILPRSASAVLIASACFTLAACGGEKTAGSNVQMRDMEVVDGTVNDSMTDLDAVKADGVGAVNGTGNESRPKARKTDEEAASSDAEAVASE